MKLYRCQMLDESLEDWEDCIVAAMESQEEQDFYYDDKNPLRKWERVDKILIDSGYGDYTEEHIEFFFPYTMNGYDYFDKIEKNVPQYAWDTDYANFVYIDPNTKNNAEDKND